MFPITIGSSSFNYGPFEIPYTNVTGAGVGRYRARYGIVPRKLLIGYSLPNDPKKRYISFGLQQGDAGQHTADAFRAHLPPERWVGEGPFVQIKEALGFSHTSVRVIVALLVGLTIAGVVTWAVMVNLNKNRNVAPTSTSDTSSVKAPASATSTARTPGSR